MTRHDKQYSKFIEASGGSIVPLGSKPEETTSSAGCTEINEAIPRSVVNLLPTWLRETVLALPKDFFMMTEEELVKKIFPGTSGVRPKPDMVSSRLRIQFWEEYDKTQRENRKEMDISSVVDRICSLAYFKDKVFGLRLAYVLTPPSTYVLTITECLMLGIERMREVMNTSAVDEMGNVNDKLADIQLRMFQTLDLRLNGAVAQRIDQRILTANVSAEQAGGAAAARNLSLEQINQRIAELEQKQRDPQILAPATIEVDLMRDTSLAQQEKERVR